MNYPESVIWPIAFGSAAIGFCAAHAILALPGTPPQRHLQDFNQPK